MGQSDAWLWGRSLHREMSAPSSRPALLACLLHTPRGSSWPSCNPTTYTLFPTPSRCFPLVSLLLHAVLLSLCLPFVRRVTFQFQPSPRKCISIGHGNDGCNGTLFSLCFRSGNQSFQDDFTSSGNFRIKRRSIATILWKISHRAISIIRTWFTFTNSLAAIRSFTVYWVGN